MNHCSQGLPISRACSLTCKRRRCTWQSSCGHNQSTQQHIILYDLYEKKDFQNVGLPSLQCPSFWLKIILLYVDLIILVHSAWKPIYHSAFMYMNAIGDFRLRTLLRHYKDSNHRNSEPSPNVYIVRIHVT